jgi:hypothetical protein
VKKFRERRITTNSDSVILTNNKSNKRSISPIERGIEVLDDRSIMDLHIAPEETLVHETAGRFTITHNGTITDVEVAPSDEKIVLIKKRNGESYQECFWRLIS